MVAEYEGVTLHLSSTNATGYKGVTQTPYSRFQAQCGHGVEKKTLGSFDTDAVATCTFDNIHEAVLTRRLAKVRR